MQDVRYGETATNAKPAGSGIALEFSGKRIPLKWHRLRRRGNDPLFGADTFAHGAQIGAAMEVDLRICADGQFAVLHNDTLEQETDGQGPVCACSASSLKRFHYRAPDGAVPQRVLIAEDLARGLIGAHPETKLQLDMKDSFDDVGEEATTKLADLFAGVDRNVIVSGDSTPLTLALSERLPNLTRGLEPSFRLIDLYRAGRRDELAGQLVSELRGPVRPQIAYLAWRLVLAARSDGIDLVSICHAEGVLVDAWTFALTDPQQGFSDPEWRDFLAILELGADQITTDEAIATERSFLQRIGSG